ncbi:TrbC/VirB2 family protein [Xanthomonas sp. 60]
MKKTTIAVSARRTLASRIALMTMLCALPGLALAGGGGGTDGLPFEGAMSQLVDSLTGPIAFAISVIGVVAAGGMLIFGGDMNGFMRSIVFLILVIGLIVSASALLSNMFGVSGAIAAAAPGLSWMSQGLC